MPKHVATIPCTKFESWNLNECSVERLITAISIGNFSLSVESNSFNGMQCNGTFPFDQDGNFKLMLKVASVCKLC